MLVLEDYWVWDSWMVDDGERYHLFFLKAPKSLGDPGHRHMNAVVGHAASEDLYTWEVLPDALHPRPGSWDDKAIWTGSVVRVGDRWRMYYTAVSTRELGIKDQRIGIVESDDLITWQRVGTQAAVMPDPRWYKTNEDQQTSETWRDPQVFADPDGNGWHMLIAARGRGAEPKDDGLIGYAWSPDGLSWEVGAPVTEAGGGFGEVEVAQVRVIDGQPILVFTCHPYQQSTARREAVGLFCTYSIAGETVFGPWDIHRAEPFRAEPSLFAAPLIQQRNGRWALVGFRNLEPEGIHAFWILDPIEVHVENGVLVGDASYLSDAPPLSGNY